MKAFIQLFLANLREFTRDRMALFWTIAFPVLFIVIFGLVFGGDRSFSAEIGLVVEDQSPVGQGLAQSFKSVELLEIREGTREELIETLKAGEIDALVVVPAGTGEAVERGETATIEVRYDPSRNRAQTALPIIDSVLQSAAQRIRPVPEIFALQPVTVQSIRLRTIDFFISGILAMAIMQLGLFATAQPMIALRVQGVLRRLSATPLPRGTLLAAYVALRLLIALVQTGIIIFLGIALFDMTMAGSWLTFSAVLILGAFTFIAIGFFVAAVAKSEESGAALASVIQFPMMFLSGLFFPVESMPVFLRPIVEAIPLTYLTDAFRQIMLQATPVHSMTVNVMVLLAWLVGTSLLALRLFKWDTT